MKKQVRPTLHVAVSPQEYTRVLAAAKAKYEGQGSRSMFCRWAILRAVEEVLGASKPKGRAA